MDNQNVYEEINDEEGRITELIDENGNAEKYLVLASFPYRKKWYCAFQKLEVEEGEDNDEVLLFERRNGDIKNLHIIEDPELLDEVFAEFCHIYEQCEDSDEAEMLD